MDHLTFTQHRLLSSPQTLFSKYCTNRQLRHNNNKNTQHKQTVAFELWELLSWKRWKITSHLCRKHIQLSEKSQTGI